MSYREIAILNPDYSGALIAKAIESQYLDWYENDSSWFYEDTYKGSRKKREVLEVLLLFDKVRLIGADDTANYSNLQSTGCVEIESYISNDKFKFFAAKDELTNAYAMFLKPIVLGYARNMFFQGDIGVSFKKRGIQPLKVLSELYNIRFNHPHNQEIVDIAIDAFSKMRHKIGGVVDTNTLPEKDMAIASPELIFEIYIRRLGNFASILIYYLDLSNDNNAVLLQDEFDFRRIVLNSSNSKIPHQSNYLSAFHILSLQLRNLVGPLPKLQTFDDVFRLKERRGKEIGALRDVVGEVEECLREGREKAAARAIQAVDKASRDLRYGLKLGGVSRWCTYLSLPVGIVEAFCGLPPVTGLTTAIIGVGSTAFSERLIARNNWLHLAL